jgi:hypothetical protein
MPTDLDTRIAARLECLNDDPLDFFDYGMLYAFEITEARVRSLASKPRELVTVTDVLKIIAEERESVNLGGLHSFFMAESSKARIVEGAGACETGPGRKRNGAVSTARRPLVRAAAGGQQD